MHIQQGKMQMLAG